MSQLAFFMRLAISGVPGTGKSTLGKLIAEYTTLEYFPEIENIVLQEMGFSSYAELAAKKGDPKGIIEHFFVSLYRKIEEESKRNEYVTDKCLLDMGARWFGRMWSGATPEQHDEVRRVMERMAEGRFYDKIIYLPLVMDRATEAGSFSRTTDTNARYQRSLILQGLFSEYKVTFREYDFKFSDPPEKVISDLGLNDFKRS